MLYIFDNCKDAIRTLPLMMYDEHKPEDLDTDMEDHIADSLRYFCMMRPIAPRKIEVKQTPMYDPLNQYVEKSKYNKAIFRRL
jgi:N12 class adenine-specific DNA methylase